MFNNKYIIIVHQVLTHLIHTFSHPTTYLVTSHLSSSHSLIGMDDSLSSMSQQPKPGQYTENPRKVEGLLSLVK
jgi:hypothetical protein